MRVHFNTKMLFCQYRNSTAQIVVIELIFIILVRRNLDTEGDLGVYCDGKLKRIFEKQGKSEGFDSCDWPGNLKLDSNRQFFCPCDREIWWMKNSRAFFLRQALCIISNILVNSNWIYSSETLNSGWIGDMLSCVILKFDGWPWKTIGYLFYATSSFVQHFVAIGEF